MRNSFFTLFLGLSALSSTPAFATNWTAALDLQTRSFGWARDDAVVESSQLDAGAAIGFGGDTGFKLRARAGISWRELEITRTNLNIQLGVLLGPSPAEISGQPLRTGFFGDVEAAFGIDLGLDGTTLDPFLDLYGSFGPSANDERMSATIFDAGGGARLSIRPNRFLLFELGGRVGYRSLSLDPGEDENISLKPQRFPIGLRAGLELFGPIGLSFKVRGAVIDRREVSLAVGWMF